MKIKGRIEIDAERKTVTIHLDNGAYCVNLYPQAAGRFLSEEIDYLLEDDGEPMYPIGVFSYD